MLIYITDINHPEVSTQTTMEVQPICTKQTSEKENIIITIIMLTKTYQTGIDHMNIRYNIRAYNYYDNY